MFKYQVYWDKKLFDRKESIGWRKCRTFFEALRTAFGALREGYLYIRIKRA